MFRIESLLSVRQFLSPQLCGDRLYFLSNLGGRLSLYVMNAGGSIPEPLLPPNISLQWPHLVEGRPFVVLPEQGKILLMMDRDGDERYQPMVLPLEGGYPERAFGDRFEGLRVICTLADPARGVAYFSAQNLAEEKASTWVGNVVTGELTCLHEGVWDGVVHTASSDHDRAVVLTEYLIGDVILRLWQREREGLEPLFGIPLEERAGGESPLTGLSFPQLTADGKHVICITSVHEDTFAPGLLELEGSARMEAVRVTGRVHQGAGVLYGLEALGGDRYLLSYNIDGCSWVYEGRLEVASRTLILERVVVGKGLLSGGVVQAISYDPTSDRYVLSFSSAISPPQLYTVEGPDRQTVCLHTREKLLGLPLELLSAGEDASFRSHDGLRISARLYLPSPALGFSGPRPLVYWVHGGPQVQERPNFTMFSAPLIQLLTLNGFAVFVPNVRGSTGYGLSFTKHVDRDWGGKDRLDHVEAMKVLSADPRVDTRRAAVSGRSYGGYMTLMLAGCHPELWRAAVDLVGPYDLLTFYQRTPPAWHPYLKLTLGDPEVDRDFLVERSPKSHIHRVACPMLVIQGRNDPRVAEAESADLVAQLRSRGQEVEYLIFEDEGHDVTRLENRIVCYNRMVDFLRRQLEP